MVLLNRDDIEMSSASADEQRSCDWTALGNRATPSYPDSQTLSTKPASMEGGVRIKHEVPFLCRNRRPPDKIPGLTQMRLHRNRSTLWMQQSPRSIRSHTEQNITGRVKSLTWPDRSRLRSAHR